MRHTKLKKREKKKAQAYTDTSSGWPQMCRAGRCHANSDVSSILYLSAFANSTDLEILAVLLENTLVVVLPESLCGILTGESLEDLYATGVLFQELCGFKG